MKKSRYTPEQIAIALRQAENSTPVVEVCRKMGIAEQTFHWWKKMYIGMRVGEVRRLKALWHENQKLEQLVAGIGPDKQISQDVLERMPWCLPR